MPARVEPGPGLWLYRIAEDESVGTVLSPNDRHRLIAIAMQSFKVRALQRECFRDRSRDVLSACQIAERELDKLLGASLQGGLDL